MFSGACGRDPAALPMRVGWEAAGVVAVVGERAVGPAVVIEVGEEVVAFPIVGG
jgi:NADPH2:quinone reductase